MSAEVLRPAAVLAAAALVAATADAESWLIEADKLWLGPYELSLQAPYRDLVPVEGVAGDALRFDGNTTWAISDGPVELPLDQGLALGAWVAVASPPVEHASVIHLKGEGGDLRLSIGPWMQPEFRIGPLRAASFEQLPVGRWVHLGAVWDGLSARLFVDGEEVARHAGELPSSFTGVLSVGFSQDAGERYETHPLGVWNGPIDALTLRFGDSDPVLPEVGPPLSADVAPPAAWFAADAHRPRFHPMPPAGWTNEPHTLHKRDGIWHLYHQANPNGPFWEHIVWGHLVSPDLVTWQAQLPALMPGTGFDRRGVWVGNLIPGIEPPAVLYTGVNGERSGLGRADWQAGGGFLRREPAVSFVTPPGYQDMRDPYIVRVQDHWLALVGSGARDRSGALILAFVSEDAEEWRFLDEFDVGGARMPGEYWELPVLRPVGERWLLMGTPVMHDVPTRTLYWIGDFDGERFVPDDPEPRAYDLFRTLLSPTLAGDEDGRLIAIGIVPDDGQRPEAVRAEAGWVHALSLPFEVALCPDDGRRLCQSLAREVQDAFGDEMDLAVEQDEATPRLHFDEGPVRLTMTVRAAEGATASVVFDAAGGAGEVARLLLRPAEGLVALDNTAPASVAWARTDTVWSEVERADALALDIVVDGAAITGTIGRRPFAALLYPHAEPTGSIVVETDGDAEVVALRLARLNH